MTRFFALCVLILAADAAVAQDTTRLSLLFLGDIMQHDSQIEDAYDRETGAYDYRPCFRLVEGTIRAADLAIGNLEVTLAGRPYKGYPQFSAPDELLHALKDIGMDVLVTANNHSVDRGRKGVERTLDMLDSAGMLHTGTFRTSAEKEKTYPLLVERHGFRIAILNFTYGTNGLPVARPNVVNMMDTAAIRADLTRAAGYQPDAIIVFPHWGPEYQSLPSKQQKEIASFCFKHGATLVVGSHPHVVQPMEWRKQENQLVAYSLGNFVSGQRKRYTDGGAMLRVELEKVSYPDQAPVTVIDTAGYVLEWVYRTNDANRDYFVIPLGADELPRLPDAAAQAAMQIFADDSRQLFDKHNRNVFEVGGAPAYQVSFSATDTLAVTHYLRDYAGFGNVRSDAFPLLKVGPLNYLDAQHLYRRIRRDLPVEDLALEKILPGEF